MNSSSQEYMDSDLIFIYLFSHLFFFSTWGRKNCFGLLKALMLRSEFKIAIVKKKQRANQTRRYSYKYVWIYTYVEIEKKYIFDYLNYDAPRQK